MLLCLKPFDAHCCHMGIKHPVPDRVKPSFVIFDIRALWASECPDVKNYKWRLNPVWHRMLYSCTHMATVGVKGITFRSVGHGVCVLTLTEACCQWSLERWDVPRMTAAVWLESCCLCWQRDAAACCHDRLPRSRWRSSITTSPPPGSAHNSHTDQSQSLTECRTIQRPTWHGQLLTIALKLDCFQSTSTHNALRPDHSARPNSTSWVGSSAMITSPTRLNSTGSRVFVSSEHFSWVEWSWVEL